MLSAAATCSVVSRAPDHTVVDMTLPHMQVIAGMQLCKLLMVNWYCAFCLKQMV